VPNEWQRTTLSSGAIVTPLQQPASRLHLLEVEPLEHGREAAVDKLIDPSLEVFLVPTGWVGARRRKI
jgi:hypothetical protein